MRPPEHRSDDMNDASDAVGDEQYDAIWGEGAAARRRAEIRALERVLRGRRQRFAEEMDRGEGDRRDNGDYGSEGSHPSTDRLG